MNKKLLELLKQVEPSIGWRSTHTSNPSLFRCEFCGESHIDFTQIPHHDECLVSRIRAVLSEAPTERAAKIIREEIVRQYRDDERGKCRAGALFYEQEVSPHLIALALASAGLLEEKSCQMS